MNPPCLDAKEEEASQPQEPTLAAVSETNSPPDAPLPRTEMAMPTIAPPELQAVKIERDIPSEHAPAMAESDHPSVNATVSTEVGFPPQRTPARKKPKLTPVVRPTGFVIIDNAIKFFSEGNYSPSRLRASWEREESTKSDENDNKTMAVPKNGGENSPEEYPFPTSGLPSLDSNDETKEEAKEDACSGVFKEKVT